MKKMFVLVAAIVCLFTACNLLNPYGKKVKIDEYVEVYYTGEGVTEAEAKSLGNYIAETWKDLKNKKSYQLTKSNDEYVVKMVIDKDKLKDNPSLDLSFMAMRMLFETEVFKGKKVALVLTDNEFKEIKRFDDKAAEPTTTTDSTGTK